MPGSQLLRTCSSAAEPSRPLGALHTASKRSRAASQSPGRALRPLPRRAPPSGGARTFPSGLASGQQITSGHRFSRARSSEENPGFCAALPTPSGVPPGARKPGQEKFGVDSKRKPVPAPTNHGVLFHPKVTSRCRPPMKRRSLAWLSQR